MSTSARPTSCRATSTRASSCVTPVEDPRPARRPARHARALPRRRHQRVGPARGRHLDPPARDRAGAPLGAARAHARAHRRGRGGPGDRRRPGVSDPPRPRKPLRETVADARVTVPTRGNRKLERLLDGRQRRPRREGAVVRVGGQRHRAAGHVRPLLGAHPDRGQHRAAAWRGCCSGAAWCRAWSPTTASRSATPRSSSPPARCSTASACRCTAPTTRRSRCSSPPTACRGCSRTSTASPSAR